MCGEVLSSDHQVHELYSETQDEKSTDPSGTDTSLSFSTAAGSSNLDAQNYHQHCSSSKSGGIGIRKSASEVTDGFF